MREFKFRAFDKKAKVMSPIVFTLERLWLENGALAYKDFEIMQYTGLKDNNGKEIYEGDIVTGRGGVVEWDKDCFVVDGRRLRYVECEVIGNIYENPELEAKDAE